MTTPCRACIAIGKEPRLCSLHPNSMKHPSFLLPLLVLSSFGTSAFSAVRLPAIFGDHMVLQQSSRLPVWGWADPGEKVTVSAAGQHVSATAGADGKWKVQLDALQRTGETIEIQIAGSTNTIALKDVLVGDVWVCSGQSNMEWPLWATNNGRAEAAQANYPQIRLFKVAHKTSLEPLSDCEGKWVVCDPATAGGFSAVAYYFGRDLHRNLNSPIGLVGAHWGGTMIQAWTSLEGFEYDSALKGFTTAFHELAANRAKYEEEFNSKILPAWEQEYNKWMEEVRKPYDEACRGWAIEVQKAKQEGKPVPPRPEISRTMGGKPSCRTQSANNATVLFNGMIAPLLPFAIKGAIWYQGESNANNPALYGKQLPALIADWRKHWGQGDFPFLFVQLPNMTNPSDWAAMREVQLQTLAVPNTGMAITIDVGEHKDIHPKNKMEVGARLALAARHVAYGQDLVYSGPVYQRMQIEGQKARLTFAHVGGGLTIGLEQAPGSSLKGFAVAGEDKVFVPAEARIEKETVVAWSEKVPKPVAVRYGWASDPEVNLYNKEGLPASPFRTDDWPLSPR